MCNCLICLLRCHFAHVLSRIANEGFWILSFFYGDAFLGCWVALSFLFLGWGHGRKRTGWVGSRYRKIRFFFVVVGDLVVRNFYGWPFSLVGELMVRTRGWGHDLPFQRCRGRCWGKRAIFALVSDAFFFFTDCSNLSNLSMLAPHWIFFCQIFSLHVGGASHLGQVEWVVLCVTFAMLASGDRGLAVWSFLSVLPTKCHYPFSFSANTQAVGRLFWEWGCEMNPTGGFTTHDHYRTTEIRKGYFCRQGPEHQRPSSMDRK